MRLELIVKQRDLTDEEHFVRLCSRQKQIRDEDGKLLGVTWEAFSLRVDRNETYLSGALLECFAGDQATQMKAVLKAMGAGGLKFGDNHAVALCEAGVMRKCGDQQKRRLRVRHEPKKANSSYSAVRGLPADNSDTELLSLLAAESLVSCHLVSDVKMY